MINKLCLVFLLIFFKFFDAIGQNPYLRPIGYPYQLPTNTIYDLYTDKIGRLWLGTDKGLLRFNGKNSNQIPFITTKQMEVTHLQEDKNGEIWGMNFASQIFYTQNDTLRLLEIPSYISSVSSVINYLVYDDFIWIITTNRLTKMHIHSKKIYFSYNLSEKNNYISDLVLFENKEIHIVNFPQKEYIIIPVGADSTTKNCKKIKLVLEKDARLLVVKNKIYSIQKSHSERKMAVFENYEWKKLPDIDNINTSFPIYHFSKTDEKDIWICTKEGGFKWNIEEKRAELYFPNKNITDVVRDYQGNYWISTLDTGLWFCPSLATKVYNPLPFLSEKGEVITQIQKDDKENSFWLGASKGKLYNTNLEGKNVKIYQNDFLREITRIFPRDSKVWTNSGIFDKNITKNSISLKKIFPKDLRVYQDKYLLTATSHHGSFMMPFEDKVKYNGKILGFMPEAINKTFIDCPVHNLKQRRAYAVELDTIRKKFWVGYDDNLYQYDFEGNQKVIKINDNESIVARRMALDKSGKLYVGTFSQGVLIIDNQKVIHQIHQKNGLKTDIVRSVKNVRDTIWIATDEEVGYLQSPNYALVDILNDNAMGKIYFQDFYPDFNDLLLVVNTDIISLPIHRTVVREQLNCLPIKKGGDIFSPYFVIEALSYKNPSQTKIYYRLKGIDKDWQIIQDITATIKYSNLSYGHYIFEFYTTDEVSNLKSEIYKVNFEVPKKWYQTYLFYFFISFVIVLFFYWITHIYLQKYKERHTQKEKLLSSQLTALRSQMNPHFLYNILNTVQGLVYSNLKKEAGQLLGYFSDLMRKSLQASEEAYISLKDEIEILQLYILLEKSRFDNNFSYIFDVENVQEYSSKKIPSMLIQPFVENAFKHGLLHQKGHKKLFIQMSIINQKILKIVIDDNGVGRKISTEINQKNKNKSTGFATKASEKRMELLNYEQKEKIKLHIIDKIQGTKIEILIPFV